MSLLVSAPQRLLLVRTTHTNNHETTLVVPDLALTQLVYFRMLVDGQRPFEEHAVVLLEHNLSSDEKGVVVCALQAARPTGVTFIRSELKEELVLAGMFLPHLNRASHQEFDEACVAAAACAWKSDPKTPLGTASPPREEWTVFVRSNQRRLRLSQLDQFYSCDWSD